MMAFVRAIGAKESDIELRADDDIAKSFLPFQLRLLLSSYAEILAGKTYRGSEAFKASLAKMGEPVAGGISEFGIVEYLRQFGFELVSLLRPEDIESRYLTSSKGTSTAPYGFLNIIRARKVAQ
jgi:hypothetical protein